MDSRRPTYGGTRERLAGYAVIALVAYGLLVSITAAESHAAPVFTDDFESGSLSQWTTVGRQVVPGTVTVVARDGSKVAEVYHASFTEIGLERTFAFDATYTFEFDMEAVVNSQSPPAPNYYAEAGMIFVFLDDQDEPLGQVSYIRATTNFPFDTLGPDPTREAVSIGAGMLHYSVTVEELLALITIETADIATIAMKAQSYGSTYPYPAVNGTVWFDNVRVCLGPCPTDTTTTTTFTTVTTTTLDRCQGLLRDADGDGEADVTDRCPDTAAGAAVDDGGCSLAQFCGAITATTKPGSRACRKADWQNDEPVMKRNASDCEVANAAKGRTDDLCRPAAR